MIIIEIIPYLNSSERRQLVKELRECKVFIYPDYILTERAVTMQ